jgi:hypothetical protein
MKATQEEYKKEVNDELKRIIKFLVCYLPMVLMLCVLLSVFYNEIKKYFENNIEIEN